MCGRFRLTRQDKALADRFEVEEDVDWTPRYNIAPTQSVAVIRQDSHEPRRHYSRMRWGLIPFWAKDPSIGYKMINARAETIAEKAAFRNALKARRCLIPADGFYEWKKLDTSKQPFNFGMADDSIFAFAGIWEQWKDPAGALIETCSIITTTPNELTADVHDRMPVILAPDDYDLWLDPGLTRSDAVVDLLRPFDAKLMRCYPVSTRVNLVKNDDPSCCEVAGAVGA